MNLKMRLKRAEQKARDRVDSKKEIIYRAVFGPHNDDDIEPGTIVYRGVFDFPTDAREEDEQ